MEGASSSSSQQYEEPEVVVVQEKFDVFLSFRGEDTRNIFVGHLYSALLRKGIHVFLDDRGIERGKTISLQLLNAIRNSRCSIVILSDNYVTSTWCLEELLIIMECNISKNHKVIPVFYHLLPTHVRKQTGPLGEAFAKHEEAFQDNLFRVQLWRYALTQVSNLAGHYLENRCEAKFIEEIVTNVSNEVASLNIEKGVFGMESHLEKLNSYASVGMDGVRIIGISGNCGIGKTTIAKAYYKWMSSRFEGSSFLENVREKNPVLLQKQLLCDTLKEYCGVSDLREGANMIRERLRNKRVLIVIDNLDASLELESLAGGLDWFGSRSRIIVTTRDENLLVRHGVNIIYNVEQLNKEVALQFFSWHTFKNVKPFEDYQDISKQVVEQIDGIPLALEVMGSFLKDKSVEDWKRTLDRVKSCQKNDTVSIYRVCFDELEETEKNILLEIACFYKRSNKDSVIEMLDCCGFLNPKSVIESLIDKCFLKIRDDKIWMYDFVEEMGREIVQEESEDAGSRSRLWLQKDIRHVLRHKTGSENVKAICFSASYMVGMPRLTSTPWIESHFPYSCESYNKMTKLRLLILRFDASDEPKLLPDLEHLSNELRFLEWHRYPFQKLPPSFQPDHLVRLKMPYSELESLWDANTKPLPTLQLIDLNNSKKLTDINFKVVPNLKVLSLEGCDKFTRIDSYITNLHKLVFLDLDHCKNLSHLPETMEGLESLRVFRLRGCVQLHGLPEDLGHLKNLTELSVYASGIKSLPSSVENSKLLKVE